MLLVRIGAEQDEAVFLGNQAPAGAVRLAAGLRIGLPHCVEERPVDEGRNGLPDHPENDERRDGLRPRAEEIVAGPLHRKATLALYQFMNAEIDRLIVRYTAMMTAMPSIACPVWFIEVFAIDTRSG